MVVVWFGLRVIDYVIEAEPGGVREENIRGSFIGEDVLVFAQQGDY